MKNIVLITSHQLRHQHFINRLNSHFPIGSVFIEQFKYPDDSQGTKEEKEAWNWFFSRRDSYEKEIFGPSEHLSTINQPSVIQIPTGKLNSPQIIEKIIESKPDLIVIFGTSIVGPELLEKFSGRIFNLHAGITSHYRGSSCNFWPIVHRKLEYLGATILRVNQETDTGEIIEQETINMEEEDDEQILIGKTILLGTQLMTKAISDWQKGALQSHPLKEKGKLYLIKDFQPKNVLEVMNMVNRNELKPMIQTQNKRRTKS